MDLSKSQAREIASETLQHVSRLLNPLSSISSTDPCSDWLVTALSATRLFSPQLPIPSSPAVLVEQTAPTERPPLEVRIVQTTTLVALEALAQNSDDASEICVLNFASGRNPGGGFIKGARAQEESLVRASGLYSCLTCPTSQKFYQDNESLDHKGLYHHGVIYSPSVPVFRRDTGEWLSTPLKMSVITAAAPNAKVAGERHVSDLIIRECYTRRAFRVLRVALHYGHRTLILGAWGCGVFGNDCQVVAGIWRDLLNTLNSSSTRGSLERVIFAITEESMVRDFEWAFRRVPLRRLPTLHWPSIHDLDAKCDKSIIATPSSRTEETKEEETKK